MIDLHAHVLPGVDDGPSDLEGSIALARAAVAAGTRVIAATPHIGHTYPVVPLELPARVRDLQRELERAGVPLRVIVGGELAPSRVLELSESELEAVALGGSRCLLLECPFSPAAELMSRVLHHLQAHGFRVLLAHPERSPTYAPDPARLAALVEHGAYVQLTAGSLRGDFGRVVRRVCHAMLERGLVHVVASDAHDADLRSPALWEPVRAAVPEDLARWLTEIAPGALVDDAALPSPPPPRARRSRWFS